MSPIRIYLSNGNAYVWTPDEVYELRSKHHLTGILVGTLPSVAQQNVFLGLPLLLLPEEVVLLVEDGNAILTDDVVAHNTAPSSNAIALWHEFTRQEQQAQAQRLAESEATFKPGNKGKAKFALPDVANAKRAEREAKRLVAQSSSLQPASGSSATEVDLSALLNTSDTAASEAPLPPKPNSSQASASVRTGGTHMVTVPATSTSLPWYPSSLAHSSFALKSPITASLLRNSQLSHEHTTLASARNAGIWSYPSTQAERAKCAVFRDLRQQGYWMGGGLKFGGDWLVYPGDSLRYHSHFVATVFPTPTSSLRPMEIVALGRLGTATKKSHLLCGWDETTGKVDYYSIEWAGFG